MPTIDLILATVGRTDEPARFLRALDAQRYRDVRLIVVDQNGDDRLASILSGFEHAFPILHLRSELGLSRARNVGLQHASAMIVGFPDDDCWYPAGLLERVARFFATHSKHGGLSGRAVDETGRPSGGQWDRHAGPVTRFNVWKRTCAYTVFLRRSAVEATGQFDEALGLGPAVSWPAAEDLDYVLRGVQRGVSVYYDPTLLVHHRQAREGSADPSAEAGYRYGLGAGRILRKNRLPSWFAGYYCGRPFAAAGLALLQGETRKARFYWSVGRGRVCGWRSPSTLP
jgi:GT2 family glycosyltransferase